MATMEKLARRVEKLTADLERARDELRGAVVAAHDSGESVSEIARRLEVTRARVYQLIERSRR